MKKNNAVQRKAAVQLGEGQREAIMLLSKAYDAMMNLSRLRAENKLSNNRVSSVAKELAELKKVMSAYEDQVY